MGQLWKRGEEEKESMRNPKINGTLLCKILNRIGIMKGENWEKKPKDWGECEKNYEEAIRSMRQRNIDYIFDMPNNIIKAIMEGEDIIL